MLKTKVLREIKSYQNLRNRHLLVQSMYENIREMYENC